VAEAMRAANEVMTEVSYRVVMEAWPTRYGSLMED